MKSSTLSIVSIVATTSVALAGTETLYTISPPPGAHPGWASTIEYLPDLNGDGVGELATAAREHGGFAKTHVFSGSDGAHMYDITQAHHILFFGRGIEGIADQTGDGIPEIVIAGFQSGDANSPEGRLHVHSGADGTLVRELIAPQGMSFQEGRILALEDADGDGHEDILVRLKSGMLGTPHFQLFSSMTGLPLFVHSPEVPQSSVLQNPIRTSDYDGDGHDDFIVGLTFGIQGERHIQIRSGRLGVVLNQLSSDNFDVMTGNGEPLVAMADRDSDGHDDFALGGLFFGLVGAYSSADATIFREWECDVPVCLGSVLINLGDLNGDGSEDLLTVEGDPLSQFGVELVALDLVTGDRIFSEAIPDVNAGYGGADPLVPMPGVDRSFPTFALFEFQNDHISVRRVVPSGGDCGFVYPSYCSGVATSIGVPARMTGSGSGSVLANDLVLDCVDLPPGNFGYFLMSQSKSAVGPPGSAGMLCLGSPLVRFAGSVQNSGASGQVSFAPDATSLPNGAVWSLGDTWNFQYWTRDGQNPSNFSNLAAITFCQ